MQRLLSGSAGVLLAVALAGCASEPTRLAAGSSRAQALQTLGAPTAQYPRPEGGERLQYSRQPAGNEVNNLDFDGAGRLVGVTQVMHERVFAALIQPDAWRVADVLYHFGRPEEVSRVHAFDGQIWQWRYLDLNNRRLLYIYIDPQGVVRRWHVGDDLRYVPATERH